MFTSAALSATVALIIFPISVELESSIHAHRYGIGYGLGWAGTFSFLAAAVCMSLDDLVRESSRTKCCRLCWRGQRSERNELRQVWHNVSLGKRGWRLFNWTNHILKGGAKLNEPIIFNILFYEEGKHLLISTNHIQDGGALLKERIIF